MIRFSISFILAVFLLNNYNFAGTSYARGRKDSVKIVGVEKVKPVYQTVRISSTVPKIDGRLNDQCWLKDGDWSGNYTQQMPEEGVAPSQETELKILFDDANIYVTIRAHDTEPDKIDFRPAERDGFNGDVVGLAFDSYNDQRTAFEFNLTASGGKIDLLLMNDHWDVNWNAVWDGKTALEDSAWTAEFRIPLSQLRYAKNMEQEWGLHAWRWLSRNAEESQWALIPRDSRADFYGDRFHTFTGQEIFLDPEDNVYHIDETANGSIDYEFSNPDFNFRQFRSNLVARWEYRPGSILYLVWQHSRTDYDDVTDPSLANNMGQLWDIYPTDILMLKLNYWFSL